MSKLPQHIEELFDKKFKKKFEYYELEFGDYGPPKDDSFVTEVKSFIATILKEEMERIVNRIEKLKIEAIDNNGCTGIITSGWCCPKHKLVDNTLDKVINLIKEDK